MSGAISNNKRPIQTEVFIDLTNSDDEVTTRPAKRARSGSVRSTPPDLKPLNLEDTGNTRNASPPKSRHADRIGSTQPKSVTPPINGVKRVNLYATSSEQKGLETTTSLSTNEQKDSSESSDRLENSLRDGLEDRLSIRRSTSRQVPINRAHSLEVVELDSESDRDASKKSRNLSKASKANSLDIPGNNLSLSDWVKPEVQPIRFDPNVEPSKSSNVTSASSVSSNTNGILKSHAPSSGLFRGLPQVVRNAVSPFKPPQPRSTSQLPKAPTVIVPPSEHQVLRRIKDDITYIRTHPQEVENSLGVARFNDTDLNAAVFNKAKQKRRKGYVEREALSLGLGTTAPSKNVKDDTIIEPRSAVRHILLERFKHCHDAPLSFKNRIDERCLDGKFQFVSKYIWSRRVMERNKAPLPFRACRCAPTELCQGVCSCANIQAKESGEDLKEMLGIRPYERNDKGIFVLSQDILKLSSHPVIYECTDACSCGISCTNKVVQKGRTVALQIFETGRCGFGVKAMQDIAQGQFIDLYLGEVLTVSEVQKRENAAEEDTPSYVMSLDMFATDKKLTLYVDGANFGSLTRFVNHSCEPNAKTIPVVLSEDTRHIYHVAFFAIKDIHRGSEITIDYDPDWKDANQQHDEPLDSTIVQCKCGAANCRRRLWMPGNEKRVRRRYLRDPDDD